jgi:hypothetical protein
LIKEIVERELSEVRESMRMILEKARHRKCQTNLTKDEINGKKKAMMDENRVFLPADKGRIMVAMDKWES